LTPPCPGIVEAFCIGSCQDLFRGEDWRLGLFFSLKAAVAGPQCSKQAETRLAGIPTILRAGRAGDHLGARTFKRACRNPRMPENGILGLCRQ